MDLLHLRDPDQVVLCDVIGTGVTVWDNDVHEGVNGRWYPPTREKCLGVLADDGRFFAVRLVYGDDLPALAQQVFHDSNLRIAREFQERFKPGPDDYQGLFGALLPVVKPQAPSRNR